MLKSKTIKTMIILFSFYTPKTKTIFFVLVKLKVSEELEVTAGSRVLNSQFDTKTKNKKKLFFFKFLENKMKRE